ncbi:hypothetical protein [Clostridium sp. DL1XJH146]
MKELFKDEGVEFLKLVNKLNSYEIKTKLPSMRKTLKHFKFEEIYDEILNYIGYLDHILTQLDVYFEDNMQEDVNVSYRIKSESSLRLKWNKNLNQSKQLREVCNDVIGIRIISDIEKDIIVEHFSKQKNSTKLDIVDFNSNPKKIDDGYRAVHLYIKNNPASFPIEIQFCTRKDALLNFYTHEVIYKKSRDIEKLRYSSDLRNWLNNIPEVPQEIEISFIDYLYKIVYSKFGGDE